MHWTYDELLAVPLALYEVLAEELEREEAEAASRQLRDAM
jgi:hypothetical protein